MLPKVVVYNSLSVDGAIKDFEIDIALHYEILGTLGADALLAGSNTAKTGIELFMETVPAEKTSDYFKPKIEPNDDRPLWVIADSRGILQGLMHVHRNSGYAKDIVVLVSKATPNSYLDYLVERKYDFILTGEDHIDYRLALEELNTSFGIKTVVTDSGGILASVLLEAGLVDELHLLISPQIVGEKSVHLFRSLSNPIRLSFLKAEPIRGSHILLSYEVTK
jgi:2,5-diamino-6-(ribosylamino)-4(3H)-pyrimidinone 5'-phosphate reductase